MSATERSVPREAGVILTSVHGDMHGAHGLFRKGWPYEESVRVPLLVRPPGGTTPASRIQSLVTLLDVPAITRSWAASEAWEPPVREELEISMPSVVDLAHQCDRVWRGTRSARRKTIYNRDGTVWLEFDLARDPFELENLAASPRAAR